MHIILLIHPQPPAKVVFMKYFDITICVRYLGVCVYAKKEKTSRLYVFMTASLIN